ncbi:MAG: dockerin type I domain-containing protein [Pseudomonadota bacterium]
MCRRYSRSLVAVEMLFKSVKPACLLLATCVSVNSIVFAQSPPALGTLPHEELVPDPAAYEAAKSAPRPLARRASPTSPIPPGPSPKIVMSFEGIYDPSSTPPDETSAIGPTRLVEFINTRLGIFDRHGILLDSGSAQQFTGANASAFVSDPQILWDPSSQRFYYTIYENRSHAGGADPGIAWGFSTTSSPSSLSDFCNYFSRFTYGGQFPYGVFPDFPQLGMTRDFLLVGANRFSFDRVFIGADLVWISKPPPGTTCPAPNSFRSGIFEQVKSADGLEAFTLIPARQVDANSTGWVVSAVFPGGNFLNVYSVRPGAAAGPPLLSSAARVNVPEYLIPVDAQQAGTTTSGEPAPLLDTGSGKLTQAYAAFDPRLGHIAIWTAHAVYGGAGSEIRWYEIDPSQRRLDQSGVITDPSANTFFFYGSIAPDRAVHGTTARFGSNMVLGFNQSSATTDVQIAMVSKTGAAPQSASVVVKSSPGPNIDFNCFNNDRGACRWGDYSSASHDPTPPNNTGQVWLTNEWSVGSGDDNDYDSRTWNWVATPGRVASGDVNGDGVVNCTDVKIVKAVFGKTCNQAGYNSLADVNQDCAIDIRDLATVSQQLIQGTTCQ